MRPILRPSVVWLLTACMAAAQVAAPRIGCYGDSQSGFEILGLAGSFAVRPVAACAAVESPWHVVVGPGPDGGSEQAWLERRDAVSDAVQDRIKLGAGSWAVFADGTPVNLDELRLPGPVLEWRLVAHDWMLIRVEGAMILFHDGSQWFYLPGLIAGDAQ